MLDFPSAGLTIGQIFTSGSASWKWDGTKWLPNSTGAGGGARATSTPANPAATTNTTGVMAGFALAFTPTQSGNVFIAITISGNNNINGRGVFIGIRYGTGTAPANGAAMTGTQVGGGAFTNAINLNNTLSLTAIGIASGLTPGTAYWIDMTYGAMTSGSANMFGPSLTAFEI